MSCTPWSCGSPVAVVILCHGFASTFTFAFDTCALAVAAHSEACRCDVRVERASWYNGGARKGGRGGGARTLGYVSTKCFANAMAYSSGLHRLEHCLAT